MAFIRWSKNARKRVNEHLTGKALFDLEGAGYWSLLIFQSGVAGRNPLDAELVAEVHAWEDYNIANNYNMDSPGAYDLSYNIGRLLDNKFNPVPTNYTNAKDTFPIFGKLLVGSASKYHCANIADNLVHSVNKPIPTEDITMDFSRITSLIPAINSGTANYFIIKEINPTKKEAQSPTIRPMLFGSIGVFGSGADMEMADVNIIQDKLYRFPPVSLKLPIGPLSIESV